MCIRDRENVVSQRLIGPRVMEGRRKIQVTIQDHHDGAIETVLTGLEMNSFIELLGIF